MDGDGFVEMMFLTSERKRYDSELVLRIVYRVWCRLESSDGFIDRPCVGVDVTLQKQRGFCCACMKGAQGFYDAGVEERPRSKSPKYILAPEVIPEHLHNGSSSPTGHDDEKMRFTHRSGSQPDTLQ
jgi:hypothetical protein